MSLVIATCDRPRLLLETIRSVLEGRSVPREIIVADQSRSAPAGMDDVAVPDGCRIVHVPLTSVGVARARNEAIRAAGYETVVITDDDVLVWPGWLECLVGTLDAAPLRTVVTGLVLPEPNPRPGAFAPSVHGEEDRAQVGKNVLHVFEGRVGSDPLFSASMAIRRGALREIGLFDERLGPGAGFFRSAVDNDLGFRLLEAGYRLVLVGDAVLVHRSWRPYKALVGLQWAYGVGQGAFYAKHLRAAPSHMLKRLARDVSFRARRSPRRRLREPRQLVADVVHIIGLLIGLGAWVIRHGWRRGEEPRLGDHTYSPSERATGS